MYHGITRVAKEEMMEEESAMITGRDKKPVQ
jgi:hypothetical protein